MFIRINKVQADAVTSACKGLVSTAALLRRIGDLPLASLSSEAGTVLPLTRAEAEAVYFQLPKATATERKLSDLFTGFGLVNESRIPSSLLDDCLELVLSGPKASLRTFYRDRETASLFARVVITNRAFSGYGDPEERVHIHDHLYLFEAAAIKVALISTAPGMDAAITLSDYLLLLDGENNGYFVGQEGF